MRRCLEKQENKKTGCKSVWTWVNLIKTRGRLARSLKGAKLKRPQQVNDEMFKLSTGEIRNKKWDSTLYPLLAKKWETLVLLIVGRNSRKARILWPTLGVQISVANSRRIQWCLVKFRMRIYNDQANPLFYIHPWENLTLYKGTFV